MTQSPTGEHAPVITLWETYGSGMQSIAKKLSEQFGLTLFEQAFTSEELDDQIADTPPNPLLERVLEILGSASTNTHQATSSGAFVQKLRDNEQLERENTETVLRQASEGGIIMGRNGTKILAGRPNTLHVKFDGRVSDRVARAQEFFGISQHDAERRQRIEDDARTRMSVELYGWNPMDNDDFDLVINTSLLAPEQIVSVIDAAMRAKGVTLA